jgi:putative aldouronate transport system permease protein
MVKNKIIRMKLFDYINYVALILFTLTFIIPFLIVLRNSFMTNHDIMYHGNRLFPTEIVFDSYKYLIIDNSFFTNALLVSVYITVLGTFLQVFVTAMMAYALSKKVLPYRTTITFIVFFTMLFGGGLIPSYLLVISLGLYNTLWTLILPTLVSPWLMFLMRNFFNQIPPSLEESATIDGASPFTILLKIVIPISMPSIASISLFYAVGNWNSWFAAIIYISDRGKWPVQVMLREIVNSMALSELDQGDAAVMQISQESIRAAAIMTATLPIMCVYPYLQKYFVKGMTLGSIKG